MPYTLYLIFVEELQISKVTLLRLTINHRFKILKTQGKYLNPNYICRCACLRICVRVYKNKINMVKIGIFETIVIINIINNPKCI